MDMLQEELDRKQAEWNFHRLKKSKNAESPCGIQEMLYFTPEIEVITIGVNLCHNAII